VTETPLPTDRLVPLREALNALPLHIPRPHEATVRHWAEEGVVVGGRRVRLAALRRGCRWFSTAESILAFFEQLNPAPAEEGDRVA
jgi:hypothetical protein